MAGFGFGFFVVADMKKPLGHQRALQSASLIFIIKPLLSGMPGEICFPLNQKQKHS